MPWWFYNVVSNSDHTICEVPRAASLKGLVHKYMTMDQMQCKNVWYSFGICDWNTLASLRRIKKLFNHITVMLFRWQIKESWIVGDGESACCCSWWGLTDAADFSKWVAVTLETIEPPGGRIFLTLVRCWLSPLVQELWVTHCAFTIQILLCQYFRLWSNTSK